MSFYHWFPSHPNECELSGGVDKLHDIGQELRVSAARQEQRPAQTDFQRISSVPDVWSQHRLFDMLLLNDALDPSYVEYESIAKREWRAMLAIVVLAESYGVSLQTRTIDFREGQPLSAYIRAAYSVRPSRDHWDTMDVFYIEKDGREYPIAMTSPTVHLVPTKDAWDSLRAIYPGRIPWLTSEMANAPVVERRGTATPFMLPGAEGERSFAMLPVHALMLKEWLAMYRAQVPETQNKDILEQYEEALNQAYHLNGGTMPDITGFFAAETQRTGLKLLNVRVPNKLQIFLDHVFYSRIEQNSAASSIPDTHKFAGGISPQSIFSQQKQGGDYAHFFVAMPVTETFWQLWQSNLNCSPTYAIDCEFVARSVELSSITVTVTFGDIRFSKTYSESEIDNTYWRNLCTAGIWPRQKIANWTDYFMICYEVNDYRIEPLKRRPEYRAKTYDRRDGIDGSITYYKLTYAPECCVLLKNNAPIGYFLIRDRQELPNGDDNRVYRAAMDFGTSSTTIYGGLEGVPSNRLSGINLWSLPLINTYDAEGIENSRLERYFFPPLPTPKERGGQRRQPEHKTISYSELIADPNLAARYPSCIPMQTILADAISENVARNYLRDSWIYFRGFAAKREVEYWPTIYSNLKWAQADPVNQHRIRAILAQMLVMIALEARSQRCGKIKLTASYPLAFDEMTRKAFYTALNEMLRAVCATTGLLIVPPGGAEAGVGSQDEFVDTITESEAVFRFTVSQDEGAENYYVVDIGGGSTDIFISMNGEGNKRNSYSTSLGFGARKVLLDKLTHRENEILKLLMRRADDGIDKVIVDKEKYVANIYGPNANSIIEDLFALRVPFDPDNPAAALVANNFGDAFMHYCAGNRSDSLLLSLKKRIAFYLAASIWLSGMMLRGDSNPKLSVALLFAGNGSKMISWVEPDLERIRFFVYQLFQEAAGISIQRENFGCLFSDMPKEEVAFGALMDLREGLIDERRVTAKQIYFDRKDDHDSDIKTYHSIHYGRKDIETDQAEFERFLKAYRQCAIASFDWAFERDEYDASIIDRRGIEGGIRKSQPDKGYFLSAVEVVSNFYLGPTAEKRTV
ncbi:MAG: hypothetical protein VB062_01100 [Christensenella sp.]|nr:hypothetical protein [Christensenella sp.]